MVLYTVQILKPRVFLRHLGNNFRRALPRPLAGIVLSGRRAPELCSLARSTPNQAHKLATSEHESRSIALAMYGTCPCSGVSILQSSGSHVLVPPSHMLIDSIGNPTPKCPLTRFDVSLIFVLGRAHCLCRGPSRI
jgi:hypothetical protein